MTSSNGVLITRLCAALRCAMPLYAVLSVPRV
eukprot:COSAG06_NODE_16828_length_978_cov_1.440273_1_plen_31_part_10